MLETYKDNAKTNVAEYRMSVVMSGSFLIATCANIKHHTDPLFPILYFVKIKHLLPCVHFLS